MRSLQLSKYRKNVFGNIGLLPCPVYGGDGILEEIFACIGYASQPPKVVEFGEERVLGTTTRYVRLTQAANAVYFSASLGWRSRALNFADVLLAAWRLRDIRLLRFYRSLPRKFLATPANIRKRLDYPHHQVIDLLVVDIDSYDFDIVEALLDSNYRPRVFIVEYNPSLPLDRPLKLKKEYEFTHVSNPRLYGASLTAWVALFSKLGYDLVYVEGFTNLYFVGSWTRHPFSVAEVELEAATTRCEILDFAQSYCQPGFLPSWFDADDLTAPLIDEYFEATQEKE